MARRLILDTGVLVGIEPAGKALSFAPHDDVCIAAVTAAELLQGVELADARRRQGREDFVTAILAVVPVEEYGLDTARTHARLLAHVRRAGKPRGAHDLMIAATAVATARAVVTRDRRAAFADLPGVRIAELGG
ncbi:PIN domain-containing protein [Streptomyces sp. NBC_01476]|uniref:PIN domain-containing protein n=1 Tax=Streptomyces sp. NBC_01476 TaxID=2903881 RepID=UPI002E376B27|nr:PIN domain-containing protein [Streptomyces sp. NBC_01476]